MKKMIVLPRISEDQQHELRQLAPDWKIVFDKNEAIGTDIYREAEIICGWNAEAEQLSLQPGTQLRWVQGWAAGVDMMPLDKFEQRGVLLSSASGVHPAPMSETAFALMLALTRKVHVAVRHQQSQLWNRDFRLGEMHGKTLLVVGAGEIGREIAKLAKAFDMQVLGVRRSGNDALFIDRMYSLDGLNAALALSDYVVNVLPLTEATDRLFDEARIASMKNSAFYINIGRGATTDTAALAAALAEGRLAGAGLDVFETEPLPADHPLWRLDNVIVSPHVAGMSDHYNERAVELFLHNLKHYLTQDISAMRSVVNYEHQY
ncbi:D-2-hydroxyacid dehydrogenase [Paenibacillaceae bacterium]|nr:D-2-hydroxyacid dehydrogenase [Paenibacillaceae bacterium]